MVREVRELEKERGSQGKVRRVIFKMGHLKVKVLEFLKFILLISVSTRMLYQEIREISLSSRERQ